jgi:hypothetical protein
LLIHALKLYNYTFRRADKKMKQWYDYFLPMKQQLL